MKVKLIDIENFPEGTVLDHGWLYGLCQDYEYGDEEDED